MLKDEDLVIQIMRTDDGKDCVIVTHVPTKISRGDSLKGTSAHQLTRQFRAEIEEELVNRGLHEHIVRPRTRKGEA
jgi:hypothetical protein